MPDKVLNFVKDHFLMDSVIRSQPLLLKRNVRYTQLAVHRVQALHNTYDVLFIGTGEAQMRICTIFVMSCYVCTKETSVLLNMGAQCPLLDRECNFTSK